jgi:hypothetical protein
VVAGADRQVHGHEAAIANALDVEALGVCDMRDADVVD